MNHGSPRGSNGGGGSCTNYWSYSSKSADEHREDLIEAQRKALLVRIRNGLQTEADLAAFEAKCEKERPDSEYQQKEALRLREELAQRRELAETQARRARILAVNAASIDFEYLRTVRCSVAPGDVEEWRAKLAQHLATLTGCRAPSHKIRECEDLIWRFERELHSR